MPRLRKERLIGLGLLVAVAAGFGQTVFHGFSGSDDHLYVFENERVLGGLSWENLSWALGSDHAFNWHPLTWWSLQADASLFGRDPRGYHLSNVLLHAAATVALFAALRLLTGTRWRSVFVAALFGLHPLRVESVAWVSERKDVLCGLFWSLTLLAYAWFARRPALGRYLLVCLAFVLSLLAKPMAVTLPCVLLLLDYWPLGRARPTVPAATAKSRLALGHILRPWRPLLREKLPLFALSLASCLVTCSVQRDAMRSLEATALPDRLANALVSYLIYVYQSFWPSDLAVLYPYPVDGVPAWQWGGAAALLLGATVLVVGAARRCPYLAVGWLWYLGTLVPVIGIVQVGIQAHADRYTYIPSIGLFLAAVWAVADLAAKAHRERLAAVAGAVALAAAFTLTCVQGTYWRNDVVLWRHTLAVTGADNPYAQRGLGSAYLLQGEAEFGIHHYLEAIRLGLGRPGLPLAPLHDVIGVRLYERHQFEQAVWHLEQAHQLDPANTSYQSNLAVALVAAGRVEEAITRLRAVLDSNPEYHLGWYNLGLALEKKGATPDEVVAAFRRAVALDPQRGHYHAFLAFALSRRGDVGAARLEYQEVFRLQPHWPESYNRKAWELATNPDQRRRNGAEAVRLAEMVCEGTAERVPRFLDTRAAAYAEAGRFDRAVASARTALELVKAGPSNPQMVQLLEECVRRYQAREPVRDPSLRRSP